MPEFIKALRTRLAARPDTEHEQALVRIVLAMVLGLYMLKGLDFEEGGALSPEVKVFFSYFAVSAGILAWTLLSSSVSHLRRFITLVADFGTVTWTMWYFEERALALYLVYVWVTLANGFRFGPRYLLLSLGLSVAGFSTVLATSPYWRAHLDEGAGLLLGLLVLSLYVLSLVNRMFDALSRAEAANQAKRRFISVVSHEMRTPLNAIIGMADLLRDTQLSREQADMLQTLRSSSQMMLGLVEEVLDFSKIEAGKLTLERTPFDLHALVNSTSRIVAAQASAKGVQFVVSIMPEVPPALLGDPHHLRQILINLASNAVKFTEKGSVTLHVSAEGEEGPAVRLKFSIRDTGIGIAPEAQKRIFESFAQADQSTTRRFGGTGLGTTIARQLVELMGGRIGVESAVGLGSTFWFEVALDKQPEKAETGSGELADARVLLVGFPAAELGPLSEALASWGAAPVAVAGIEEGAERLAAEISLAKPYHSALIYGASGTAGAQLAQRYARAVPNPAPPAILAVPRENQVQRFAALSAGYAAVLELPFDKRQLFNVLHSVAAGDEVREGVVRLEDYARRGAGGRKCSVLAADDNPTNREVIGKILERGGHTVTLVSDGDEVLEALEKAHYDIVLLDRNMTRMGGVEALQMIRLMGRGLERIPVIVLSADVTQDARNECLEAGADAFLPKPIEAMRLLEGIQELVASGVGAPAAAGERNYAPQGAPAATPFAQMQVVNPETLAQLEALGSAGFLERLINVFVEDNEVLMQKVQSSVAARNFVEFRNYLHAMKGSAASMGAERLTRICNDQGKLSDSELRLQSPQLVKSLEQELTAARGALERHLQDQRRSAV
ncbi:MAG: response regulator [Proteobacteria bacterium]|nr:response regulator [Pseudomonadota bacterium]